MYMSYVVEFHVSICLSSVLKTKEELSGNNEKLQSEVSLTNCWLVNSSFSIVQM